MLRCAKLLMTTRALAVWKSGALAKRKTHPRESVSIQDHCDRDRDRDRDRVWRFCCVAVAAPVTRAYLQESAQHDSQQQSLQAQFCGTYPFHHTVRTRLAFPLRSGYDQCDSRGR